MDIQTVNKMCSKIQILADRLTQSEVVKTIQDLKLPLSVHLSIMGEYSFIVKNGRYPTKRDLKLRKLI